MVNPSNCVLYREVIKPVIEMLSVHADVANVTLTVKNSIIDDPCVNVDKLRV